MRLLLSILLALAFVTPVFAEKRVALVIGNGHYQSVSPLRNPSHDARAIASALIQAGFEVTHVSDANYRDMRKAIIDFGASLTADAIALFYYAGHGVQFDGQNYMVPIDARLTKRDYAEVESININAVLKRMAAATTRLNIVILDACRNNPFRAFKRGGARGLAVTQIPGGTYIAYATGPGQVAEDGDGRHSPFSKALVRNLKQPGLDLDSLFRQVRVEVMQATNRQQIPWSSSSVTGNFYFLPIAQSAKSKTLKRQTVRANLTPDLETRAWASVSNSRDAYQHVAFLKQHANGRYRGRSLEFLREEWRCEDAPLPTLDFRKAGLSTRPNHRRFLGVWGGKWKQRVCARLAIYEIDPAGRFKGYLSVGKGAKVPPGYRSIKGQIKDNKILFGRLKKFVFIAGHPVPTIIRSIRKFDGKIEAKGIWVRLKP